MFITNALNLRQILIFTHLTNQSNSSHYFKRLISLKKL